MTSKQNPDFSSKHRTWWQATIPWLLVALLSLPACAFLLQPGFFASDDGLFHVYRVQALADAVRAGDFFPRWFPEFGFGYGQPVLNFYSPLVYYAALPFTLLGNIAATKIVIALGFVLPALSMFGATRRLWGTAGGVLAAAVYTYFPYHLADGLLRGALAEHVAFVWPPLILWSAWRVVSARQARAWPLLLHAAAWAGLILTHNLTALMIAPVWLGFVVMAAWGTRNRRNIPSTFASFAAALSLTAFYWLPVLAESNAVKLGSDPLSTGYRAHLLELPNLVARTFLHAYRPAPDAPLAHQLGLSVTLLVLATVAIAAWRGLQRQLKFTNQRLFSPRVAWFVGAAVAFVVAAGLVTTQAQPIWLATEFVLSHLQYPWRWLTIAALGSSIVIGALPALVTRQRVGQAAIFGVVSVVLMTAGLTQLPYVVLPRSEESITPEQMWAEDAANGQVGATWTAEFLPMGVTEQRWALGRAAIEPRELAPPSTPPQVALQAREENAYEMQVRATEAQEIRLHAFYFPGWQVRVDGQRVPTSASTELGLVTAHVPAGAHVVSIAFEETLPRQLGWALSVLTWWGALLWLFLSGTVPFRQRRGLVGITVAALLPVACWLATLAPVRWQPTPVAATVGTQAQLIGVDAPKQIAAGQNAAVTLYWFNQRDTNENYKAFVHLVDTSGRVVAQHDGDPGGGFTPTTRWRPNELILDRHILPLPGNLPPGEYVLKAGLYQTEPLQNLPVEPATEDQRVFLATLRVQP